MWLCESNSWIESAMRGRLRGWFPSCPQSQRWVGIVATPASSLRSSVTLARTSERRPWTEQYTRLRNWQSVLRAKFLHFGVRAPRWGHKWSQRREIWENFDMCEIASCTKAASRWQRDLNWHHDTSLSYGSAQGWLVWAPTSPLQVELEVQRKKYQWWLGFYFGRQQMVRLTLVQQQPVYYFFLKSPQKLESSSFTSLPSRKCTTSSGTSAGLVMTTPVECSLQKVQQGFSSNSKLKQVLLWEGCRQRAKYAVLWDD